MSDGFSKIGKSISIIDRLMKMYYDKALKDCNIGWGQQFFLELIYENPGISPQELSKVMHVDKATVTKVTQYLEKVQYITIESSQNDKRMRHLFVTEEAKPIISQIKKIHKQFYIDITKNIPPGETQMLDENLEQMLSNLTQHVWHRMDAEKGEFIE